MIGLCADCKEKYFAAGQAFTYYKCDNCGKKDLWHNTNVPKICANCAEKYKRCIKCGEKMC
ncbi:MAG: hypothetical protein WC307_06625 [Candidatus Nanoarchaeia archaeon]|jgi:DNA-directed RNA polymerase subunit RPC12/RpoP